MTYIYKAHNKQEAKDFTNYLNESKECESWSCTYNKIDNVWSFEIELNIRAELRMRGIKL